MSGWKEYPEEKLDDIFDSKHRFMNAIYDADGDNDYDKPHSGK